ncbi:hypothetical protein MWU61_06075 [Loktanella sp. F6476L]|uniref:hypothetical protein n=1 Tax=Loktanella sp. F6476L TaxID=2926405 RepID=UPI001FF3FADC|nr:hypothetical protein [Loktanella sp. F6476L]MCK0120097.1 hypothetical protein [Loktanella sp. F6476L]
MADTQTPVFLCFKWGQGYPCKYTNILYRALSDIMTTPFRMVCITDDTTGLADGIETQPLPEFAIDRADWVKGMWPKLSAFAPGIIAPGTPVIMVDVDVVVLQDLTPLFDHIKRKGGLHIIQEIPDTLPRMFPSMFGKPLMSNSSVVGFVAGTQDHLFEMFHDKTYDQLREFRNDQNFIHYHAKDKQSWPLGWMLSFKKSLAYHFPLGLFRPIARPKDAYIVIFHGKPNPEDMTKGAFTRWGSNEKFGYFPVKWIKEYWQKYVRPTDI